MDGKQLILDWIASLTPAQKLFGLWGIMVGLPVWLMFKFRSSLSQRQFREEEARTQSELMSKSTSIDTKPKELTQGGKIPKS